MDALLSEIRACRTCIDTPLAKPLPHEPNPVLRVSATARLCISSQAPGTRVHRSGIPFTDASGDRLRSWLGVTPDEFYDTRRVAIVPMGFCFPGQDARGADLPPRPECAPLWRERVLRAMPQIELMLLVGQYAQAWHLKHRHGNTSLTAMVGAWRDILHQTARPRLLPMPHPSWRNNGWLKANPWFETELLPALRCEVRRFLDAD